MYQNLLKKLDKTTLVLTANERLSRQLLKGFAERQNNNAWEKPFIFSFNAWLTTLWAQLQDLFLLDHLPKKLSPWQSLLVWEKIVKQSPLHDLLLRPMETAQKAQQAWELAWEYSVAPHELNEFSTEDTYALLNWGIQFEETIKKRQMIEEKKIIDTLDHYLNAILAYIPKKIILCGFVELTPKQQQFIEKLHDHHVKIEHFNAPSSNVLPLIHVFDDEHAEWMAIANWAKQLLNKKEKKVGIVVPNLSQVWKKFESTLRRAFSPESILIQHSEKNPCFNISSGNKLSKHPIIKDALLILHAQQFKLPIDKLAQLILSPFIVDAEKSYFERQKIVEIFFKDIKEECYLSEVKKIAESENYLLNLPISRFDFSSQKKYFSEWGQLFAEILYQWGWPGERQVNSSEYQAIEHWKKLVTDFAKLDIVQQEPLSYAQALAYLSREANNRLFQIKTEDKPIQILGTLEAAGLDFDHLWVCGLNNETWPDYPHPNPFLSVAIQQKYNMPHASADRELNFAKALMNDFKCAKKQCVFSYAKSEADQQRDPSPLIKDYPMVFYPQDLDKNNFGEKLFLSKKLENYDDTKGQALPKGLPIKGGSSALKHYSACPFKGYAITQLNAQTPPLASLGFDAKQRGVLLHNVLEFFWKQIKTQQNLLNKTEDELTNLLNRCIDTACNTMLKNITQAYPPELIALEKQRILTIVIKLMQQEKKRSSFNVDICEQRVEATLAGMVFKLRIDRIDQLASGEKIIIDYKTRKYQLSDWLGTRPYEPQLPLYCVASDQAAQGLVIAQLHAQEVTFKGIINLSDKEIPGVKSFEKIQSRCQVDSFDALKQQWHAILTELANQIQQGDATVDPKLGKQTCRECGLQGVCRIYEKK